MRGALNIARGVALALLIAAPQPALAGGLWLPTHGVRGAARGGAFTAGGDDPGGIWYNPANIGGLEGFHVLVDSSLVLLQMDYTRVDSGGNLLPTVSNEVGIVPIPTIGLASSAFDKRLTFGFSFSAPYSPLPAYPRPNYGACANIEQPRDCIDTVHSDSPQRYSLVNLNGTLFLQADFAVAYRPIPQLTIGLSVQNMFANFVQLQSISSDNGVLASGPEDPDFDSLSQTKLVDLFNPSAKIGVIVEPHPMVRLGASLQLPFWISGDAEITVQLPVSPLYEKSSVVGSTADLAITFPLTLRLGAEVRPVEGLRIELGFDWAQWSVLDAFSVDPKDIYILNIPSIDRFKVPTQTITLNFRDTFVIRLGGEYFFKRLPLILRAGYIFERGAVEDVYASVLAMDANKHIFSVGLGYVLFGYRLDLLYAYQLTPARDVFFDQSKSPQVNPINPTGAAMVGGGRYSSGVNVLGLGVSKAF
jgi:long-chain fatty acid transport protein